MRLSAWVAVCVVLGLQQSLSADYTAAPQDFLQEVAVRFTGETGAPNGPVQLIDTPADGKLRAFSAGKWYQFGGSKWDLSAALQPSKETSFAFVAQSGQRIQVEVPWGEVRQILRFG